MPRMARKNLEGINLFHIMVQGINKEKIFEEEREKKEYIKLIKEYQEMYELSIISYCIMDNHAHMLIKINEINKLTEYMHKLNTSYGIYYNKNKNRVGYVFRNRFKTQVIKDRRHLCNCIVYIHNNPVKAGICKCAKDYKFSSFKEILFENKLKTVKNLFINQDIYEKAHEIKNMKNMNFLEDEEGKIKNIKNEINNYLIENNSSEIELKISDELLIPIVIKLNNEYNLSNRKISEFLNIGREKIRNIINKIN